MWPHPTPIKIKVHYVNCASLRLVSSHCSTCSSHDRLLQNFMHQTQCLLHLKTAIFTCELLAEMYRWRWWQCTVIFTVYRGTYSLSILYAILFPHFQLFTWMSLPPREVAVRLSPVNCQKTITCDTFTLQSSLDVAGEVHSQGPEIMLQGYTHVVELSVNLMATVITLSSFSELTEPL